jgi:periplasmic protein TonB
MPKASRPRAVAAPVAEAAVAVKKRPARPRAQVVRTREPLTMSLPFLTVDAAPDNRLLANAIGWSILLHMVVLAIRFSPFDVPRFDRNGPPLEIALVNAKSESKPTKADILAQARLDGGGNTDANRRAKTPLPVPLKDSATQDLAVATQQVSKLEAQTREMLTQLKAMDSVVPPTPMPNDVPEVPALPNANEIMQRTLETMRLEAQIAKQMDAYQKRPKRRFVGARAEEYRFARYIEDWRMKVEGVGNRNYPIAAREQKLYGSLLITVGIRANGTLESVTVDRPSGKKILDLAAARIVEMAAPYAPFPADIRRDTDILYITRTWTFAPGDSLTSE